MYAATVSEGASWSRAASGTSIEEEKSTLSADSERALDDFLGATSLLWDESSVTDRFESTGVLTQEVAEEIGLVGPAARACGCVRDVRQDHAHGYYRFAHIPVSTYDTGDVFGRAYVRWREVQASVGFLMQHMAELESMPRGRSKRRGLGDP